MNKKFKNLIAYVIILFCLALVTLALNWYWVKNDTALQGLIFGLLFSFVGAIVGGLASGYGSYLGGVQGAKENYELSRKLSITTDQNRINEHSRQLFAQLKFSYDLIMNDDNLIPIRELIYDPEWYKHLAIINSLNQQKKELITSWFHEIIMLRNLLEISDHNQEAGSTQHMMKIFFIGGNGIMQASFVRKKLNKILPEIKKILDDNY